MKPPSQHSSVVSRVLHVLTCVARAGRPIGAKQIAAGVDAPLSTVYRHLAALKEWGLLQEHAQSGLFEPGPTGVQLAWGFDQNSLLINHSREALADLMQRTGESVGLMVPIDDQVVCLSMVETEQPLRCSFTRGRGHPLTRGASAKALLAFLPADRAEAVITAQVGDAAMAQALRAQLVDIREKRYAISANEVDDGIWGVSAPLISDAGRLEGTITLMAPLGRLTGREIEIARLTRATADRISVRL
ncbi:MAG: IclR family transcriptional regulator [Janthinobacterium lividum]